MSSRSNSDSEEEDAQDLLNRIKKNLNNDNSDEDNSENEDEDSSKDKNSQKSQEEQIDNIDVNNNDNNNQQKEESNLNKEKQNQQQLDQQKLELKQQASNSQNQNASSQQNQQVDHEDDDEVESGLNIKNILAQNGIEIDNQADQQIEEQKQQSAEDNQNNLETNQLQNNQNIQEINLSSPKKNQINQETPQNDQISQQNQFQESSNQTKQNILTVVRADAEKKEEETDHMIQELQSIKIKKPLLEDPEIINFKIDSSHLEQTMEQVKKKYDENVAKYMLKQKSIFDRIKEISKRSSNIYDSVNSSNKIFIKKKLSDKEKYVKDIQKLQNESSKTKTFLIMMIQRLESIELEIDKFTVAKLKQLSNEDNQNQSQDLNNNPQQNSQTN
ncbi:hypothetical protein TTHERM_00492960 (macronuclear) [Tetrahymena thermophila SB210]|uniref:Uncharacterized protein n=1 Tax=Tetrahymena thermophila (strain SB210) TaxID=312017 RepID=I7MHG1_TETTS|nr:hypothetical protein TTHERM_00492960 [Tetrahymena thermophila SB210]EAS02943.2 hypothetical protein TTHERM_00492960 [Tetrahymena thermophila SB210]|eukprot:XP_001023188.2 hypothetical protein TTHERM_00492960 [Tetrahymena thermophila SB210]